MKRIGRDQGHKQTAWTDGRGTHTLTKKNTLIYVCLFPDLNVVLTKACKVNMPEFCQSILNKATLESELKGQVIPASNLNTSHR